MILIDTSILVAVLRDRSGKRALIAQLAIENEVELLHNDRDFDVIASATPLKHLRLDLSKA